MEYSIQQTNYPSVYLLCQTKGLDSIAFSTSMWASYPNSQGWNMGQNLLLFDQMGDTKGRNGLERALPAKWKLLLDGTLGIRVSLKQRITLLLFRAIAHMVKCALLFISVTSAGILFSSGLMAMLTIFSDSRATASPRALRIIWNVCKAWGSCDLDVILPRSRPMVAPSSMAELAP